MIKWAGFITIFGLLVGTIQMKSIAETGQAAGYIFSQFFQAFSGTAEQIDQGSAPWSKPASPVE